MFCSKCHTELEDEAKICRRCGFDVSIQKKRFAWGQFSSSKTFERMSTKKIIENDTTKEKEENKENHNESHDEQFDYSNKFSNVTQKGNDNHQDQYYYSQNYSNTFQKQITSDEDYIRKYIGKNSQAIEKEKFSFLSLIFGPLYLVYRKLWILGIGLLIIYIYSYIYITESMGILLRFMIQLLIAYKFQSIYLTEVKKKVEQIKRENPDKTSNEILNLCEQKGGTTNTKVIILIFILYVIITSILVNHKQNEEETTYKKEMENIIYEIPTYVNEKASFENYHFYVDRSTKEGICYIKVSTSHSYTSEEEYNKEMNTFYDNYDKYNQEDTKIGKINWKRHYSSNTMSHLNIYTFIKENTLYEFSFESSNTTKDICQKDIDYILNSVK